MSNNMSKKFQRKLEIVNKQNIDKIDKEVIKLFKGGKLQHLVIIALFIGKKLPKYCTIMPRKPKPPANIIIINSMKKIYFFTIKKNPSTQDGVIMIQLDHNSPILKGFSYRIYPPPLNISRSKNMGSGYNSSLDFSGIERVVCVYYINKNEVKKFINGKVKTLYSKI